MLNPQFVDFRYKKRTLIIGFCNRKEQIYNNKKNYLYYNLKIRQIYRENSERIEYFYTLIYN
ncbi:hypothetical protein EXW64_29035 (plasmid) [Bacillus toyonensis]|nr:hypothetical protein EXW64_29035 [Bacillus toyonensis]